MDIALRFMDNVNVAFSFTFFITLLCTVNVFNFKSLMMVISFIS